MNTCQRIVARFLVLSCVAIAGGGYVIESSAETWPSRPIRLVVPFGPGGATDIVARLLQPSLSKVLGQQVVVDNRPGAAGNIAAELVARATPDGYTIFMANVSVASINPILFPVKLIADLTKEIVGVTLLASIPDVLVARADFPPHTVKDLIEHINARPGKFNFGSVLGSYSHLAMLDFHSRVGMKMVHIPVAGGGQLVTSILNGEIHYSFINSASALPYVKAGRMKAFAVTAPKRLPEYPDTPTMAEAGYPGIEAANWMGIFVPAKTPRSIVDRLHSATIRAAQQPEVAAAFAKAGVPLVLSESPEDFRKFVSNQLKLWARIIKDNNIKID
jgi:tripartite-type tricarboxylate transporter receptor subunit TctC